MSSTTTLFDLGTKVIIEVLREEGVHNDTGELIVEVVKKALSEVCLVRVSLKFAWSLATVPILSCSRSRS